MPTTKTKKRGPVPVTTPAQLHLVELPAVATSSAPVISAPAPTPATSTRCPACGHPARVDARHRLCGPCRREVDAAATAWQEADYLHAWLHARADVQGDPTVARLRRKAAALGLDWRAVPPAPMTHPARAAVLVQERLATAAGSSSSGASAGTPRHIA